MLNSFNIDVFDMYLNIFLVLGIPLTIGVYLRSNYPEVAYKINIYLRKIAILSVFIILVGMSIKYHHEALLSITTILPIVFMHNVLAMGLGHFTGSLLSRKKQKTLVFEIGIQNSGLGAALLFQFFPTFTVALVVCFWWSIVHIINSYIYCLKNK
jgi:BASS family bile acid:Na+ symporter